MGNAEQYRRRAAICLRLAQEVPQSLSDRLHEMARIWHALADQAERNDKADLVYEPPLKIRPDDPAEPC
jgi:hypothetical protein